MDKQAKKDTLLKWLNLSQNDSSWLCQTKDNHWTIGLKEYCVLTEKEANNLAYIAAKNSLWLLDTKEIMPQIRLVVPNKEKIHKAINYLQTNLKEDSNDLIVQILNRTLHGLVNLTIRRHGRGKFLAIDGKEHKLDNFFIYCTLL